MNTGRVGGPDGDERSKKVRIKHSSAIVKGIAEGTIEWERDPDFGYLVAASVPGIDEPEILQPRRLYEAAGPRATSTARWSSASRPSGPSSCAASRASRTRSSPPSRSGSPAPAAANAVRRCRTRSSGSSTSPALSERDAPRVPRRRRGVLRLAAAARHAARGRRRARAGRVRGRARPRAAAQARAGDDRAQARRGARLPAARARRRSASRTPRSRRGARAGCPTRLGPHEVDAELDGLRR